ncbi:dual OB domain-containing protein [Meiothermus taiwanensis]|uniref:Dual OB-containing domain-containing protein n=1 Tax=Meiothermus taiwanensis TaxID=172827 RepID=A0A399E710_9DEIN|nr:hypothetical protein [Meiothermus taiwanensis]RIH77762.1 hypothetical protein Mcate_01141 [Meiothermus taiwanensis]
MAVVKRILCLANSRKKSGRCVAGREALDNVPGPWIRPVSTRPNKEISKDERQYRDGSDPQVLDIIDIPFIQHQPYGCQTENWLLDANNRWTKVGQVGWVELLRYVENPATLWTNTRSTNKGENDEILQADADALQNSLFLIHVPSLKLRVFKSTDDLGNPKRRVQADFMYRNIRYALWVTDPVIERDYMDRIDDTYDLGESCLTVSLGEPFRKQNGEWCRYKLVAAVIQRESVKP